MESTITRNELHRLIDRLPDRFLADVMNVIRSMLSHWQAEDALPELRTTQDWSEAEHQAFRVEMRAFINDVSRRHPLASRSEDEIHQILRQTRAEVVAELYAD